MSRSIALTFNRNLRSFLGEARLRRSLLAQRISKTAKSHSTEPIAPLDGVFYAVNDESASDAFHSFQSITHQLLAQDVLDSLIRMKGDMLAFPEDGTMVHESAHENIAAKAVAAYQEALDHMLMDEPSPVPLN